MAKALKQFKAPKCPECKKTLNVVYEEIYETYKFNNRTGTYKEEFMGGELIVKCSNCYNYISIFEEGACNYQAK